MKLLKQLNQLVEYDETTEIVAQGKLCDVIDGITSQEEARKVVKKRLGESVGRVDISPNEKILVFCTRDNDDAYAAHWDGNEGSVYFFDDNAPLTEGARRAFKRVGKVIKRWYRCTTGRKAGKVVSDPKVCARRKEPRKVRLGRKINRQRRAIRIRKSKIVARTATARVVKRMNQRLATKTKSTPINRTMLPKPAAKLRLGK